MLHTIETKNGTLKYNIVEDGNGYKGEVAHDLHKHARFNGKVLRRYSKVYATKRGAENWLYKQINIQNAK